MHTYTHTYIHNKEKWPVTLQSPTIKLFYLEGLWRSKFGQIVIKCCSRCQFSFAVFLTFHFEYLEVRGEVSEFMWKLHSNQSPLVQHFQNQKPLTVSFKLQFIRSQSIKRPKFVLIRIKLNEELFEIHALEETVDQWIEWMEDSRYR